MRQGVVSVQEGWWLLMPVAPQQVTATIASGGTTSNIISLKGQKIVSVYVPTMTAGTLTVEACYDPDDSTTCKGMVDTSLNAIGQWSSGTFDKYLDGDTLARFMGVNGIRFVSGAAQGAARSIIVVVAQE